MVVEKQARCRIVLTPTGEYKKIHGALGGEIGQEISVRPYFTASKVAVLAAVLVIVILLSQALPVILGQNRAYAYVTLDINPSVEFAIDADYLVLSARSYNPEAENILSGLEYIGKRIDSVLAEFTHSAISLRYIGSGKQNRVVVSFYSAHTKDEQSVEAELKRITDAQQEVLRLSGEQADIDTVVIDTETHREADRLGVSAGSLEETRREEKEEKSSQKEPDQAKPTGNSDNKDNGNRVTKDDKAAEAIKDQKEDPDQIKKIEEKANNEENKVSKGKKEIEEGKEKKEEETEEKENKDTISRGKKKEKDTALNKKEKQVRKEEAISTACKENWKKVDWNGNRDRSEDSSVGKGDKCRWGKEKEKGKEQEDKKKRTMKEKGISSFVPPDTRWKRRSAD